MQRKDVKPENAVSPNGQVCFSPFCLYLIVQEKQQFKEGTFRNESLLDESTVTFTVESRTQTHDSRDVHDLLKSRVCERPTNI